MSAHRIDGYVIVSADGMLAKRIAIPAALKFKGDQDFFDAALDRVNLSFMAVIHLRPAEFAEAKAGHCHLEDRGAGARSIEPQRHAVESGRRVVRTSLRLCGGWFRHDRDHRRP